jgi:hypothetical protein
MVDQSQSVPDTVQIANLFAESGLTDLLEDIEVKKFLLAEIKEIEVSAPFHYLVYRLIKAVSGKPQSFSGR